MRSGRARKVVAFCAGVLLPLPGVEFPRMLVDSFGELMISLNEGGQLSGRDWKERQ